MIDGPAGQRSVELAALPLRIGSGADADIKVPGRVDGVVLALVSVLDGRLLLQPAGMAGVAVTLNDAPLAGAGWLADGDVVGVGSVRIRCEIRSHTAVLHYSYAATEYATLPPAAIAPEGPRIAAQPATAADTTGRSPSARWLAAAALLAFAAAAWHLVTARAVAIEVVPASAAVSLDGTLFALRLGGRYLLRPGAYTVTLSAAGHVPRSGSMTVTDAADQTFRFELARLPGLLELSVQPAVPISVTVDGKPVSADAQGYYAAAAGTRQLVVAAPRYLERTLTVDVVGAGERQQVAVALTPNWADVTVSSEPAGAAVRIGGELLGTTPATVPVVAGNAALELRLAGFRPWRQSLNVVAGEQVTLPPVRLQEVEAMLTVTSAPAGAAVTVEQRYRGRTPLEVEVPAGRALTVLVAQPGYDSASRSVTIARRGSATVSVTLAERRGLVRLTAEPGDAELFVNGVARGAASQELELPAVPQRLEVRKAGYATWTAEITPRPGQPQAIAVKLLTPQQAALAASSAVIRTPQGAELQLVQPGAFEMGAPRREQGRRPNETQRAVRLTRPYYIGLREVTNREFREFRPNHSSGAEKFRELSGAEHPVVMLSWEDAASFCNWLSARAGLPAAYQLRDGALALVEPRTTGYRLPTEAEWEWASRYNGGGGARRYAWGDQMPPTPQSGNYADQSVEGLVPNVIAGYDDGWLVTAPVGSFRASPLGLFDVGGNVAEWVYDRYTVAGSGAESVDPVGPAAGPYRVIRGASWRHASISELRLAYRDFGDQGRLDVGFRLARSPE